jgi:hypothetical protein
LTKIDKSHGELVLEDNTGRAFALDDVAKETFAAARSVHGPTRPRLIFAGKSKPIKAQPGRAHHDRLGLLLSGS